MVESRHALSASHTRAPRHILGTTYILNSSRASASEMIFFVTTANGRYSVCCASRDGSSAGSLPSGNVVDRGGRWCTFLRFAGRGWRGSGEDVRARLGASLSAPFSCKSDATKRQLRVMRGHAPARRPTLAARSMATSARPRSTSQGATRPDAGSSPVSSSASEESALLAAEAGGRPRFVPEVPSCGRP